jgi:EAL domain-containing protein (putative c-di-GMP-specific phosphodiesterase class I)
VGGDEFAVVIPTDDLGCLNRLCRSILDAAATPVGVDGDMLDFTLSIGLATTTHAHESMCRTFEGLARVSDFALYASKTGGRGRYTVYDEKLETQFFKRRAMLEELPKAIENGELELFLQPKVKLSDGHIYGFEALARWRRGGQVVPPEEFILLAEESGLVVEVDNFILNRAAEVIAAWNQRMGTEYSVSVNLSTLHFNSQRIVQWVEHVLWRTDIRPDLLTLEITESTEMRDWEQARASMSHLRVLGCKFAIDDFGTGYSSLAYLKSMPADELKIDRSLVEEIATTEKARTMLASVLEIAQTLELDIVVEGIETLEQARIVRDMGAGAGQGFLFGHPLLHDQALEAATRSSRPAIAAARD